LNARVSRVSAFVPSAGSIPIWRAKVRESENALLAWMRPPPIVSSSMPSRSTRAPVAWMPLKGAPVKVPRAVHRTHARGPSTVVSATRTSRSGMDAKSPEKYSRTPSGAVVSTCPRMNSRPPGAQQATMASRSRARSASK
jgi:hypothetical protein